MSEPLVVAHLLWYLVGRIGAVGLFLIDTGAVTPGSKVWQLTVDQRNEVTPEQLTLAQEVIGASTVRMCSNTLFGSAQHNR